jgi:hypothetical protein
VSERASEGELVYPKPRFHTATISTSFDSCSIANPPCKKTRRPETALRLPKNDRQTDGERERERERERWTDSQTETSSDHRKTDRERDERRDGRRQRQNIVFCSGAIVVVRESR